MAILTNTSPLSIVRLHSIESRRERPSQPKVCWTMQPFDWTTNPIWPDDSRTTTPAHGYMLQLCVRALSKCESHQTTFSRSTTSCRRSVSKTPPARSCTSADTTICDYISPIVSTAMNPSRPDVFPPLVVAVGGAVLRSLDLLALDDSEQRIFKKEINSAIRFVIFAFISLFIFKLFFLYPQANLETSVTIQNLKKEISDCNGFMRRIPQGGGSDDYEVCFNSESRLSPELLSKVFRLEHLKSLDLQQSQTKDEWLSEIHMATELTNLNLSATRITDKAGLQLAKSKSLKFLSLASNEISDQILKSIKSMSQLQSLSVADTRISDEGSAYITMFQKLDSLILSETKITDKTLGLLRKCPKISYLDVSDCEISSFGLSLLSDTNDITDLDVSNCKITSLKFLRGLPFRNLRELDISSNSFDTVELDEIVNLKKIVRLDISECNVSVSSLKSIMRIDSLKTIVTHDTTLSPQEIDAISTKGVIKK